MQYQYHYTKRVQNAPIRRRLDRRFVSWVLVSACVGTIVAFGFVYSARCHFEAVALGYETQTRRAELEQHEERRRQLELERVRASAPEEIEQRAKRLGLCNPAPPTTVARNDREDEKKDNERGRVRDGRNAGQQVKVSDRRVVRR